MKNVLMFLVLLGCCTFCIAQNSVSADVYTSNINEKVLIKSYLYPATISSYYLADENQTVFVYQDHSMITVEKFLENIVVNDFVISDDSLYFCGESIDGLAVMGYFNIPGLFFGVEPINFQVGFEFEEVLNNNSVINYKTKKFNKIISYKENINYGYEEGNRHVVMVGEASTVDNSYEFGCIVEMSPDVNAAYYGYNVGFHSKSGAESMLDIIRVGDYLVTAGFHMYGDYVFRIFDSYAPLSNLALPDNVFWFNNFSNYNNSPRPLLWKNNNILIAPVSNGIFASAVLCKENNEIKPYGYSLRIAKYDIGAMLINSNNSMLDQVRINILECPDVDFVQQFVSNSEKDRLGVLVEGCDFASSIGLNAQQHSYFMEINYDLNMSTGILCGATSDSMCIDRGLHGLDVFEGGNKYVLSGSCMTSKNTRTFDVETSGRTTECFSPFKTNIVDNPIIFELTESQPYYVCAKHTHMTQVHNTMQSKEINIICNK